MSANASRLVASFWPAVKSNRSRDSPRGNAKEMRPLLQSTRNRRQPLQPETPFVKSPNVSNSAKYNIPVDELQLDSEALKEAFVNHVQHTQGKHPSAATRLDHFMSAARTARDRMFDRWTRTWSRRERQQPKIVNYLSMEYL